jgi:HK97 family phage prohead protease
MSPDTVERRAVRELRAASGRKLEGYAATFDAPAPVGAFTEVVRPGAFGRSLAERRDVLALADHDPNRVLARTSSGTLRLAEDHHGLAFVLDLPDTQTGRDVLELAKRGDLGGMSFGFRVAPGGETRSGGRRELRDVDLLEVSVVQAFPAYEGTRVEARAAGRPVRLNLALRFLETV